MTYFWYSQAEHDRIMEFAKEELINGVSSIIGREHLNYVTLSLCGELVRIEYTHCSDKIDAYDSPEWDRFQADAIYLGCTEDGRIEIIEINPSVRDRSKDMYL